MVDVKVELNEIEPEVVIPALLPNPGISLRSVYQESSEKLDEPASWDDELPVGDAVAHVVGLAVATVTPTLLKHNMHQHQQNQVSPLPRYFIGRLPSTKIRCVADGVYF